MSIPGLRQPKLALNILNPTKYAATDQKTKKYVPTVQKTTKYVPTDQKYTILTLKNGMKLVVSCDSYNGIIMIGDMFKCVFCDKEIEMEISKKENHKESAEHKRCRQKYPHLEDLSENLVRQIDSKTCYCTICNVVTLPVTLTRHIVTEQHVSELNKAIKRATAYTPADNI